MKKAIVTTLVSLAFASTAFAATPAMNLEGGQFQVGYTYDNLKTTQAAYGDMGSFHSNDYQVAYGLSNKLAITGEYLDTTPKSFTTYTNGMPTGSIANFKYGTTTLGLNYQLNHNITVGVGNVQSTVKWDGASSSSSEVFGSVAYKAAVTNNVDGYASYLKSSSVEDWKTGLTYGLGSNTSLDIGYHHFKDSDLSNITASGLGFGLNHKF